MPRLMLLFVCAALIGDQYGWKWALPFIAFDMLTSLIRSFRGFDGGR